MRSISTTPGSAGIYSTLRPHSISLPGKAFTRRPRTALIRGYRSERELSEEVLQYLPLFLAARGTTYLGWLHTRQGSDAARDLTPLVERACAIAAKYLSG